jgi:pyruvoyl-dependent arginine decarboxylase (PvlArgDC)
MFSSGGTPAAPAAACPGWLITAVAPWGENAEDAYDQGLVEMGLGDSRLIEVQGAFLPMGFEATPPKALPMGSLVECHLATAFAYNGSSACAGVAWAACTTPEGEECAIVAKITTELDYEETEALLKRNLQRRLASRDLEVQSFDVAVDEVTAAQDHYGVAMAALILPESLRMSGGGNVGRVRSGLTRQATDAMADAARRVDTKAPAAPALRPGGRNPQADGSTDFSL